MKRLIKKALRDLLCDRHRAIVSLAAVVMGMLAFGTLMFSYEVIVREIKYVFSETNPPSASIVVDRVDDRLLEICQNADGIADTEVKAVYTCRIKANDGDWKNNTLYAAENYEAIKYNSVYHIDGKAQPDENEILIERDAMSVLAAKTGDPVMIELPDGKTKAYTLAGTVNDLDEHPAAMHKCVYSYVTMDELRGLGLAPNVIEFKTDGDCYDRESILEISNAFIGEIESSGYRVLKLSVSQTPGISIHLEEYQSTLIILKWFSIFLFIFGCLIISNLLSAILSNQVKQIGILKAIGAKTGNIFLAYMLGISLLIITAMGISLLMVGPAAAALVTMLMGVGNMTPVNTSASAVSYALYIAVGILIPVIVSAYPISRGLRITIREAISSYGIKAEKNAASEPKKIPFLSRPVVLSIRNAFRRKGRFILNTVILTVGGALFVAAVTCLVSTKSMLDNNLNTHLFDHQITCASATAREEIDAAAGSIPEIEGYECYSMATGKLVYPNGELGNLYTFTGLDPESRMIKPDMLEGRWLTKDDTNQVVLGHKFFREESGYKLGDTIEFLIGGKKIACEVVGVVELYSGFPIYMNQSEVEAIAPPEYIKYNVKLNLAPSDMKRSDYVAKIEEDFSNSGIHILQGQSKNELNDVMNAHFNATMRTFLIVIAFIILVSGFGLSATMNVQVAERTKEIGIMKAMGATPGRIHSIITSESIFICIFSWTLSIALGLAFSLIGTYFFGLSILSLPITLKIVPYAIALCSWLAVILVIGWFSARKASKRAVDMTIRETMME